MITIATATTCSCGESVLLVELPTFALPRRWQAHCDACLDPTEDAGPRSHVVGYGQTAPEALWDWQDSHDEAWDVDLKVTAAGRDVSCVVEVWRQARDEAQRQEGWFRRVYDTPEGHVVLWAPNRFDAAPAANAGGT